MDEDELSEPTPEQLEKIQAILTEDQARKDAWNNHPYDGILGKLPEWVPESIQRDFRNRRMRMFDDWGFSPEQALERLAGFLSIGTDKETWRNHHKSPNGRDLSPSWFLETISFFAQLRWATSLPPIEGLFHLGGKDAVHGYRMRNNLKPRTNDELTGLAMHAHSQLVISLQRMPSSAVVINSLKQFDNPTHPIVQEIDKDEKVIFWRTNKGIEKKTKFSTFGNRLTKIRKENKNPK